MKLAFIVLAHNYPNNLFRLVKHLLADGDYVVVHWDKNNPVNISALANNFFSPELRQRLFFAPRIKVIWGGWSMVAATLASLELLATKNLDLDYVVLLSGADYLLKPLPILKKFLEQNGNKDYIECVDPDVNRWVVQGLVKDRYLYHHWFNWRHHTELFNAFLSVQKKLGLKRRFPRPLKPHFGSQWWALSWPTITQVLILSRQKRLQRFFKTTWVPDELFFQTLVASLIPAQQRVNNGLTFYHFSEQGKPLTFYNDHVEFLLKQDFFFVRKLSPHATQLRDRLDAHLSHYSSDAPGSLGKVCREYQEFMSIQWRGLPNRRILGKQHDGWYGDLEWNKTPYFVILAYHAAELEPLRTALNTFPGLRCYREIFHGGYIDYGIAGGEHPLYPAGKPLLRDMKRPNFLVDLIQANKNRLTGFVLRLPCGNEMDKIVIFDPQAALIFVLPEDNYYSTEDHQLNWHQAFDNMIMYDYLAEVRNARKNLFILKTLHNQLPITDINAVVTHLSLLLTGVSTGDSL